MKGKILLTLVIMFWGIMFAQNTGVVLDGVNDYVTLGSNKLNSTMNGASGITFSMWINPYSLRTGSDANRNVLLDIPIGNTNSMTMLYLKEGGKVRFGGRSTAADNFLDYTTSSAIITTNQWQYLVGVLDFANNMIYLYLDGALIDSVSRNFASNSYVPGPGGTEVFGVNTKLSNTEFFHGMVDEIKVWNYPLTQTEIQSEQFKSYTAGNTPSGMVGYWNFQENSGTTVHDLVNGNHGTLMGGAGWDESITLPVELSYFSATITAQYFVELHWVTQSETDALGYMVYRSVDNKLEHAIQVSPLIAATNTSSTVNYIYTDEDVSAGTWYYWLQSLDMSGAFKFHGPIVATVSDPQVTPPVVPVGNGISKVFPNPFNPSVTIDYSLEKPADVSFRIYNTRGQLVQSYDLGKKSATTHKLVWDADGLPTGVYMIRMQAGNEVFHTKAVLSK